MPAVLSPSTIATTFVSIDEGADADIVVRRNRGEFLKRWAFNLACIALLLAIVPMFVVIWRREPAYFTNGIVVTMLILAIAILVLGVLGAYLWSISKTGRRRFDTPFLHVNAAGLTVRVDDSEQSAPWNRVIAMRLVGADDRSLAITVRPAVAEADQTAEPDSDAEAPVASSEGDVAYSPPDSGWQPSREDFDAITDGPVIAGDEVAAATNGRGGGSRQEADGSATIQPGARSTSPAEVPDTATESKPDRDDHWRQALYGTPHVVQMRGCKPPLSEIRPIVYNLSRGRVHIPEVSDGVLTRRWRSMLAKRATTN